MLIVTMPNDYHAHAVAWGIEQLGGNCDIFYPLDLADGATWSWKTSGKKLSVDFRDKQTNYDFETYEAVWMRRVPNLLPQEQLSDDVERASAEAEFAIFVQSAYQAIETAAFAVNPITATKLASLKPYQFHTAEACGLQLPKTLITNSRDDLKRFYDECGRDIIYKPLKATMWPVGPTATTKHLLVPTTILTPEMIDEADISSGPGIYQQRIHKRKEIRATIMGRSIFAWEKSFSDRSDLDVDWRYMHKNAQVYAIELPIHIADACFSLMEKLNLVFGCIDFAVDDNGDLFFLEINPQGQWLWGDEYGIGLNQLDAFSQFILSGSKMFSYRPSNLVSLRQFADSEEYSGFAQENEFHHGNWMTHVYHQKSFRATSSINIDPLV